MENGLCPSERFHPGGAYEIIEWLKTNNQAQLLDQLANNVEAARKQNKKQHEVWELSFDWKDYRSNEFIYQKLDYMPARLIIQAGTAIQW